MMDIKVISKLRRAGAVMIGFGLLCTAGPGQGQPLDPATAIAVRKDGFKEMGASFKNLNDELKKSTPIPFMITRNASPIGKTAARIPNWFPVGSGPSSGIKTAAKAEIWTKRADFDAIQKKLVADAAQLDKVAAGGDLKAIAAQAKVVGADCKSCHEKFRERDD